MVVSQENRQRIRSALEFALAAIQRRHGKSTVAFVAGLTGAVENTVKAYKAGARMPGVEFVQSLADAAGLPVSQLFVLLGWLPADEVVSAQTAGIAAQLSAAVATLQRLEPHAPPAPPALRRLAQAPLTAVTAILDDPDGARRFTAELSQVIAGRRFPQVAYTVAEFTPRPGTGPLSAPLAEELAQRAGLRWRPVPHRLATEPEFWLTRLELKARCFAAVQGARSGIYDWRGGFGEIWPAAARHWPTHLLIQNPVERALRRPEAQAWRPARPRALLVVGFRPTIVHAAALVAEALGWDYVPVRSVTDVTASGRVVPVQRSSVPGRVLAWNAAARHLHERDRAGDPWPALVQLSSRSLRGDDGMDAHALGQLARVPALVAYIRPPGAMLRWWARRLAASSGRADWDVDGFEARLREEVRAVEGALLERRGRHRDLLLRLPEPVEPLPLAVAQPWQLVDAQPHLARAILRWLDEELNQGRPSVFDELRPGQLRDWLPDLAADPGTPLPEPLPDLGVGC